MRDLPRRPQPIDVGVVHEEHRVVHGQSRSRRVHGAPVLDELTSPGGQVGNAADPIVNRKVHRHLIEIDQAGGRVDDEALGGVAEAAVAVAVPGCAVVDIHRERLFDVHDGR